MELQHGLIAGGAVLILALVFYNYMQERRSRKHAEQVFRSQHRDVLLDGDQPDIIPAAPGGRMEPTLPNVMTQEDDSMVPETASVVTPAAVRMSGPELPEGLQTIDSLVGIEAPAGVSASSLFMAQQALLADITKPLIWLGWDDNEHRWVELDARSPGSLNRACVALQLVNRHGAVKENDLRYFYDQLQVLCDQFLAVPRLPLKSKVLMQAQEIDRFCADVDVQIAVNVVSQGTPFPGTNIRELAEAEGMVLRTDGCFHAIDDAERTVFTLANLEAGRFSAEQLRNMHTHGLTLIIDVPRVSRPAQVFERMTEFASHLAAALGGMRVDDNRTPLSARSVELIRGQIQQFELHMVQQGIVAGGDMARRLFT